MRHFLDPLRRFPHAPDSLSHNMSVQTGPLPELEKEITYPATCYLAMNLWLSPAKSSP